MKKLALVVTVLILLLLVLSLIAPLFKGSPALAGSNNSITRTFQPSNADSYVMQNDSSKNNGTDNLMWIDSKATSENWRSFVRFDFSSIPSGSTISSSTLQLRMKDAPSASRTLQAQRASATWNESTITWSNQPAVGGSAVTTSTGTAAEVWLSWNVAADIQAFVQNQAATNYGWRIKDQTEDSATEYKESFYTLQETSNTTLRPKLAITFTAPWDSYSDSGRTTLDDDFSAPQAIVYMKGTGFDDTKTYTAAYYDGGGSKVATDTPLTPSGGVLQSEHTFLDTEAWGTWHGVVQLSTSTAFPATYAALAADPDTYGLLADDSFTTDATIPELPTLLAAVAMAGLSFGTYLWMRRRAAVRIRIKP